jgi:protein-tyrosine phosphatase
MTPIRILFVCQGDFSISTICEVAMRRIIAEEDRLDDFLLASAVLSENHIPPKLLAAAARHGLDVSGHCNRTVRHEDFRAFHLVLAVSQQAYRDLLAMCPESRRNRVRPLADFAPWLDEDELLKPSCEDAGALDRMVELIGLATRMLFELIDKPAQPAPAGRAVA